MYTVLKLCWPFEGNHGNPVTWPPVNMSLTPLVVYLLSMSCVVAYLPPPLPNCMQ